MSLVVFLQEDEDILRVYHEIISMIWKNPIQTKL